MQTLKERYAIKRLNRAQKQIINERVKRLRKQVTLIEESLLCEGGPSKETLTSAMTLLKKLDKIATDTNLEPIKAAVSEVRAQISEKFKETGGVKDFIRGLANDVMKSWTGDELFSHNPIGFGMKFMNSLIGGFSKLNDVVEVHGANSNKKSEPQNNPNPQEEKPVEEIAKMGGDINPSDKTGMSQPKAVPPTPTEKTDPTAAKQPTQNAQPDEKPGSLGAALVAANPKYKQNMGKIVTDLFDLGNYRKIIGDGKDFVKAVLDLDMTEIPRIQQAFSQMQAEIDKTSQSLNASQQAKPQASQQQATAPTQPQGNADIDSETVKTSTKKLSDQIANQLLNNKLNLKFPDKDSLSNEIGQFILSKVMNKNESAPTAAPATNTAAEPAPTAAPAASTTEPEKSVAPASPTPAEKRRARRGT